jgi:hypothetical protein
MAVSSQQNHKGEVHLLEKIQKTTVIHGMHREFCESSSSKIPSTRRRTSSIQNYRYVHLLDNLQNSCVTVRPCITILTRTKTKPVLFSFFVRTIRIGLNDL